MRDLGKIEPASGNTEVATAFRRWVSSGKGPRDAIGSTEPRESSSGSAVCHSAQAAHFHGFRRFPAPAIFLLDDNVDLQPLRAQRREQLSPAHLDREHRVGIETR